MTGKVPLFCDGHFVGYSVGFNRFVRMRWTVPERTSNREREYIAYFGGSLKRGGYRPVRGPQCPQHPPQGPHRVVFRSLRPLSRNSQIRRSGTDRINRTLESVLRKTLAISVDDDPFGTRRHGAAPPECPLLPKSSY